MIRAAEAKDEQALFSLVTEFAVSFEPRPDAFALSFKEVLGREDAVVMVAQEQEQLVGYLLGFDHPAFFANGSVSWVEEIMVREDRRRDGIGRELMATFELWARSRDSKLVALATRRASPFYTAQGYEMSAEYFRKVL